MFNSASADLKQPRISHLNIPEAPGYEDGGFNAVISEISLGGLPIDSEDDVRKLSAYRTTEIDGGAVVEHSALFLKKSWAFGDIDD